MINMVLWLKCICDECNHGIENHRNIALFLHQQRKLIYLDYDPLNTETIHHFQPLKNKSDCLFARSAVLWGSPPYESTLSLEENVTRAIPAITKFMSLAEDQLLDGFLIEVQGEHYGASVEAFAATVRRVLSVISKNDPSGLNCLEMKSINTSSWYFSYGGVPIFVTSFAPCYSPSHCRYMHLQSEADGPSTKTRCYILLQPEESFLRRGIGMDSPHTEWNNPKTVRDKVRCNFRDNGRAYHIPDTTNYPVSTSFVLPDCAMRGDGIRFWDAVRYPDTLHDHAE